MLWQSLETLSREQAGFPPTLAEQVRQVLEAGERDRRKQALVLLAESLAGNPQAHRVVGLLAATPELPARQLALELAGRVTLPRDRALFGVLLPLVRNKEMPTRARLDTAAALLQTAPKAGQVVRRVLQAVLVGAGRSRSVKLLGRLQKRRPAAGHRRDAHPVDRPDQECAARAAR